MDVLGRLSYNSQGQRINLLVFSYMLQLSVWSVACNFNKAQLQMLETFDSR